MIEVTPGDPARFMLGMNAAPETVAALSAELGLDRPVGLRYLDWLTGMLRGDFGLSYTYRVPVADLVADRLALSAPLAGLALALSTLIALPAGLYAAARRGAGGRYGGDGAVAARRCGAEFLVRDASGAGLRAAVAAVSGGRLSGLVRSGGGGCAR